MENKINAAEIGRCRKIKRLPSDWISERLKAVSSKGPKTNASTSGARLEGEFFHQQADEAENGRNVNIGGAVVEAIGADQAKQNDEAGKIRVGDFQYAHPQGNQRQVEDQEHEVADVHARDHAPEQIRGILDQQGSGGEAVDHQRAEQNRRHRGGRDAQAQERDEGSADRGVVAGLRRSDAFDGAVAKSFGMAREFLFQGIAQKLRHDGADSRQESEKKS